MILLKHVPDPQRYGVATLEGDVVTEIQEKPTSPTTSYAVAGIYFYDAKVFQSFVI